MKIICAVKMHITVLCSLLLVAQGQMDNDEWIDPYDMLNYDASTKTMRKPSEQSNYPNVPTKRREYIQDSNQVELKECNTRLENLQRVIEDYKQKMKHISQQPSCNPVFKRFLTKLLKEIEKVGMASDFLNDMYYDAKVKLSRQALAEIQKLLKGMDSWRTGALDDALSQILVELKPHDYEAWRWHFEDTFGVEVNTIIKMSVCVIIIVGIICTELWSTVSWFVQFKRIFAICFLISLVWNWFFLYEIAFAEHQNKMVKMEGVDAKCTGRKKIDWWDNLKDWGRVTFTLQDDPCKMYYEVLMVNPILLVPPTKAITMTITNFFTEPLKHFGQGISEFLKALLKDLPVTLQIPVLITIVLSILLFMYGSAQAAILHGITRTMPIGGPMDHPPPAMEQPQPSLRVLEHDPMAGGDASQGSPPLLRYRPVPSVKQEAQDLDRAYVPPMRNLQEHIRVNVETLRNADLPLSEDEIDSKRQESLSDTLLPEDGSNVEDANTPRGEDADTQIQEEPVFSGAITRGKDSQEANASQSKSSESNVACESKAVADGQAKQNAMRQPISTMQGNNMPEKSSEKKTSSISGQHVQTVGLPVPETEPTSLAL
ncbi:chloride channel CLIC-like protein 1 isoform X3 [Esox lucius]|uniref:Chloride channel CLIC-like protein 1 n=1 Tax=Esox lucius TaxID=8010 RepID=A0AAY5KE04_ESOLU|nr:chloride channel CLIC-like protein 1 isoform X3 [Esox lucius]